MANERLIWADSLKGYLMILVILGHAIQSVLVDNFSTNHVWNIIYSFHMPAFMAVSGWVTYRGVSVSKLPNSNWGGYLFLCKRRAQQLLIPYFVWSLIAFVHSCDFNFERFSKILLVPDAYLWFLWVLFWICVLFHLAQLIALKLKLNEMVFIFGTCLLFFGLMVLMEIRVFGFQFIAYYFLFYSIGYCLHKYETTKSLIIINKPISMIALAFIWIFLAWGWTMHDLPSWMPVIPNLPTTLLQYAYRGLTAMLAIIVLIGMSQNILNGRGVFNRFISGVGVISLGMYTCHLVFLGHIKDILLLLCSGVNLWLIITLTSMLAFVIASIVVRFLAKNEITARIFLGKF